MKIKLLTIICALLFGALQVKAQILDQEQTGALGETYPVGNGYYGYVGQSFTAGISGPLSKISVVIDAQNGITREATLALYAVGNDGLPTGPILASITTLVAPEPRNTLRDFTFSSPYNVTAGIKYAFKLTTDTDIAIQSVAVSTYTAGALFYEEDGNLELTNADLCFKTYVGIAPLPVSLISYTAKVEGNYAKLQWQTAQEVNNNRFEIYRSVDDKQFVKIGNVANVETDNYPSTTNSNSRTIVRLYTDKMPLNGNNYYKLVQIDNDGTATELGIRTLNFGLPTSDIRLYPNPFTTYFNIGSSQTAEASISNLAGQIIKRITLQKGETRINASQWPVGIYLLHTSGKTMKLVKN